MIGLDTNVLLRHVLQDDRAQSPLASAFIARSCTPESPGFINRVVLCELVWTLERLYKYPRTGIARLIGMLIDNTEFEIEDSSLAASALAAYEQGADFADALIAATNRPAGCIETITFDRKAARNAGMALIRD